MKTRHTATMVQPNSTFNDFNPLDVLATAASLQVQKSSLINVVIVIERLCWIHILIPMEM